MKNIFAIVIALFTMMNVQAQTEWAVDASHSSISFSVTHLLISKTTGDFSSFDIDIKSNEKLENPTVEVNIDVASISTNNEKRDNHLKADDFFDAANFPKITFKSTAFEQKEDGNFVISGDLTIKGTTKPASFEGKLNGIVDNPWGEGKKAGLELSTVVKRQDFGVGDKSPSIGNEVTVTIHLELDSK